MSKTLKFAASPGRLSDLAERLTRTLAVARALVMAGRSVELWGLQDGIGILCAKALDLPRPEARNLLPDLCELAAQVDALSLALRRQVGQPPP